MTILYILYRTTQKQRSTRHNCKNSHVVEHNREFNTSSKCSSEQSFSFLQVCKSGSQSIRNISSLTIRCNQFMYRVNTVYDTCIVFYASDYTFRLRNSTEVNTRNIILDMKIQIVYNVFYIDNTLSFITEQKFLFGSIVGQIISLADKLHIFSICNH